MSPEKIEAHSVVLSPFSPRCRNHSNLRIIWVFVSIVKPDTVCLEDGYRRLLWYVTSISVLGETDEVRVSTEFRKHGMVGGKSRECFLYIEEIDMIERPIR